MLIDPNCSSVSDGRFEQLRCLEPSSVDERRVRLLRQMSNLTKSLFENSEGFEEEDD
ncbi:hypothetical protein HanXRQr2_Chr11g0520201 [Helianthus annuus]|uniref:Uncharacterized protein n=1 Tax=Helianthus annuus TaxID=4232 RepID=A0A9K3HUB4_HELAN|nr:hypothetical protein HanXRQr2_Chr11g0520201 [Helianthus annuus]